jgi:hypothetical protein
MKGRNRKTYLACTFSPMMLGKGAGEAKIREIRFREAQQLLKGGFFSVVSHLNTAKLLTKKLGVEVEFNRENVSLTHSCRVVVCTPCFRVDEAREFTDEEIELAEFRFFSVLT